MAEVLVTISDQAMKALNKLEVQGRRALPNAARLQNGEWQIILDDDTVDLLNKLGFVGESLSDIILRLACNQHTRQVIESEGHSNQNIRKLLN